MGLRWNRSDPAQKINHLQHSGVYVTYGTVGAGGRTQEQCAHLASPAGTINCLYPGARVVPAPFQ